MTGENQEDWEKAKVGILMLMKRGHLDYEYLLERYKAGERSFELYSRICFAVFFGAQALVR